nr:MAG TPA_asm: hypothetical protein [Caudoviricetes sp.]
MRVVEETVLHRLALAQRARHTRTATQDFVLHRKSAHNPCKKRHRSI